MLIVLPDGCLQAAHSPAAPSPAFLLLLWAAPFQLPPLPEPDVRCTGLGAHSPAPLSPGSLVHFISDTSHIVALTKSCPERGGPQHSTHSPHSPQASSSTFPSSEPQPSQRIRAPFLSVLTSNTQGSHSVPPHAARTHSHTLSYNTHRPHRYTHSHAHIHT